METFFFFFFPFFRETGTYLQYRTEGFPIIHRHDYWECFVLLNGSAIHNTVKGPKHITQGHVSVLHPENEHCIIPQDKKYTELTFSVKKPIFQNLCNCINDEFYEQLLERSGPIDFYLNESMRSNIDKKVQAFLSLDPRQKSKISSIVKLLWLNILETIFLDQLQQNTLYPDWLNKFIAEIRNPENISLNVNKIYKLSNFSHSHLTRLFKKYTGKTLISYFKEVKLAHACMLLNTTDQTILNISGAVGYSSLSNFNKNFKDFYGITPTEFRKNSDFRGI